MTSGTEKTGAEETRDAVIGRYSRLARAARSGQPITDPGSAAAGSSCQAAAGYGDTSGLPGGAVQASLGCGNPTAVAPLCPGQTVLDLGSGGGLDVLLSARRVGPGGKVYGLDGSADMIALARQNAEEAGAVNTEFMLGHIEDIPLPDTSVDVIISNCVINLSADKPRVLAEAFRVLRPDGRLGISDIVADEDLDPRMRAESEALTHCATGTITVAEYRGLLIAAGFTHVNVVTSSEPVPGLRSAIVRATRPAAPAGVLIRPMTPADAAAVLAIYQAGLDTGNGSFETTAPTWTDFDRARLPLHRHVAISATGDVVGWAAASAVSSRPVYRGVIEHSVYVQPGSRGQGIGAALLDALIGSSEADGIWTIQTRIFPENQASLRLHHRAGFRVVGHREKIGCHHGRWRDVTFLERRSASAGI